MILYILLFWRDEKMIFVCDIMGGICVNIAAAVVVVSKTPPQLQPQYWLKYQVLCEDIIWEVRIVWLAMPFYC